MAAVEHSAQLVTVPNEGVRLVDQQRGAIHLHDTEDRGRRYVRGRQWPMDKTAEHVEQCGFAAALRRADHTQPRRDREDLDQVRVYDPQRNGGARSVIEYNVLPDRSRHGVEHLGSIDGLRPRLDLGKGDSPTLFVIAVLIEQSKLYARAGDEFV